MSSNFFPMLSSSPPPIDDTDSPENDDDDDDFGMFASANHDFDGSFDSPVSSKNVNCENNLSQCKKIDPENNCNNSLFSKMKIPIFSSDEKNQWKIESVVNHNDSSLPEKEVGLDDDDEKLELENKDPSSVDLVTTHEQLNNHISNEDCISGVAVSICEENDNDDAGSSQNCVPHTNMCNTAVPESFSELEIVEPCSVHKLDAQTIELVKEDVSCYLPDAENVVTDSCECKSNEASELSIFGNFASVNISESINEENELVESSVLCDALPSEHCDSNVDDGFKIVHQNCELVSEDLTSSLNKDALNLPVDNIDCEPLAVNDPIDLKPQSLSDSVCSETFDDFKCAALINSKSTVVPIESNGPDAVVSSKDFHGSEDESFGDFESVGTTTCSGLFTKANDDCKADDDFADFESSAFSCKDSWKAAEPECQSVEAGGFAKFEEADNNGDFKVFPHQAVVLKDSHRGLDKITKVISAVFPVTEEIEPSDECESNFDTLEQNSKSRRLWDKLHDNDQTPGLPFQWGVSHSFQQLLRSVNVDYHSILRTSTVPFFASGLGLLEPIKGPGTLSDNNKNDTHSKDCQRKNSKDPIPPVHFDWGSSGLVNPLDSVQVASTLIDLSFLNTSERASSESSVSKDFSLENELLKPDTSAKASSFVSTKAPILEQLLSLSANSGILTTDSIQGTRPTNLSEEAIRVLDQLPDISSVRAKVLMFPVSSNT